jgi:hypothetical protein
MLNRIKSMTLCGQMSAITFVIALSAALGVAAWTGDSAGLKLAGAIVLFGGVGLLLELFGPKPASPVSEDSEHDHAR